MRIFLLSAAVAICATFFLLWWHSRRDLLAPIDDGIRPAALSALGLRAAVGVLIGAAALLTTSALGGKVGLAALIAGALVMFYVARANWHVMIAAIRHMSWGVIPLVAGLFVMVQALKGVGVLNLASRALQHAATWPLIAGLSATSFFVGVVANAINNLPTGLIGAAAVHSAHSTMMMHAAVLLGINLGPNLSITGSLATILWLDALQRENVQVTGRQFLRVGVTLMPCALVLALLALLAVAH